MPHTLGSDGWLQWDGYSWVSAATNLTIPATKKPPERLFIAKTFCCDGWYKLLPQDSANGFPVWRSMDGTAFVYSGLSGQWFVGTAEEEQLGFECSSGLVATQVDHVGVMPHEVDEDCWMKFVVDHDTAYWHADRFISVSLEEKEENDATAAFREARDRLRAEGGVFEVKAEDACNIYNRQFENTVDGIKSLEVVADEQHTKLGLVFEAVPPERLVVKEIEMGLWASLVGLRPGDELVDISGSAAGSLKEGQFRKLMLVRPLHMLFVRPPRWNKPEIAKRSRREWTSKFQGLVLHAATEADPLAGMDSAISLCQRFSKLVVPTLLTPASVHKRLNALATFRSKFIHLCGETHLTPVESRQCEHEFFPLCMLLWNFYAMFRSICLAEMMLSSDLLEPLLVILVVLAECETAYFGITMRALDANIYGGESLLADGCERFSALVSELTEAAPSSSQLSAVTPEGSKVIDAEVPKGIVKLGWTPFSLPPEAVVTKDVQAGTWSHQAGLQNGDVLVSVNGRQPGSYEKQAFIAELKVRPLHLRFAREIPPEALRILCQAGDVPFTGTYTRMKNMMPNGWPTWKHNRKAFWIYSANGPWLIGASYDDDDQAELMQFNEDISIAMSADVHKGLLPHKMTSWLRLDRHEFIEDTMLKVTEVDVNDDGGVCLNCDKVIPHPDVSKFCNYCGAGRLTSNSQPMTYKAASRRTTQPAGDFGRWLQSLAMWAKTTFQSVSQLARSREEPLLAMRLKKTLAPGKSLVGLLESGLLAANELAQTEAKGFAAIREYCEAETTSFPQRAQAAGLTKGHAEASWSAQPMASLADFSAYRSAPVARAVQHLRAQVFAPQLQPFSEEVAAASEELRRSAAQQSTKQAARTPKGASAKNAKAPAKRCPAGHGMMRSTAVGDGWACDRCDGEIPEGLPMWSCGKCEYDLCARCVGEP
eukprot:TRINITY_DN40491_c0_g2_i2.p1 TRINITY_DN40491_c0_g2~~TRINITY_DN40491_c0_g2_i2.p1  ORF type:complete len:936 (-),score=166.08 TRINITY_DN40491_c0_g2_i2:954-3761(-)